MRRHDPIPRLTVETAPVYRCGSHGRRYLTQRSAYRRAAVDAWIAAYEGDGENEYSQLIDGFDDDDARHLRVIKRLARWLRWRDGRRAAMAMQTVVIVGPGCQACGCPPNPKPSDIYEARTSMRET